MEDNGWEWRQLRVEKFNKRGEKSDVPGESQVKKPLIWSDVSGPIPKKMVMGQWFQQVGKNEIQQNQTKVKKKTKMFYLFCVGDKPENSLTETGIYKNGSLN